MAAIPTHYLKKRDLLHAEKTSPETLSRVGRDFLALERFSDALDFFEKAKDAGGIQDIKRVALERGDTFLLARLDRFDRALVAREDWDAAARKATAQGRGSMAAFVVARFAPPPTAAGAPPVKPEEKPGETPLSEV